MNILALYYFSRAEKAGHTAVVQQVDWPCDAQELEPSDRKYHTPWDKQAYAPRFCLSQYLPLSLPTTYANDLQYAVALVLRDIAVPSRGWRASEERRSDLLYGHEPSRARSTELGLEKSLTAPRKRQGRSSRRHLYVSH